MRNNLFGLHFGFLMSHCDVTDTGSKLFTKFCKSLLIFKLPAMHVLKIFGNSSLAVPQQRVLQCLGVLRYCTVGCHLSGRHLSEHVGCPTVGVLNTFDSCSQLSNIFSYPVPTWAWSRHGQICDIQLYIYKSTSFFMEYSPIHPM